MCAVLVKIILFTINMCKKIFIQIMLFKMVVYSLAEEYNTKAKFNSIIDRPLKYVAVYQHNEISLIINYYNPTIAQNMA